MNLSFCVLNLMICAACSVSLLSSPTLAYPSYTYSCPIPGSKKRSLTLKIKSFFSPTLQLRSYSVCSLFGNKISPLFKLLFRGGLDTNLLSRYDVEKKKEMETFNCSWCCCLLCYLNNNTSTVYLIGFIFQK